MNGFEHVSLRESNILFDFHTSFCFCHGWSSNRDSLAGRRLGSLGGVGATPTPGAPPFFARRVSIHITLFLTNTSQFSEFWAPGPPGYTPRHLATHYVSPFPRHFRRRRPQAPCSPHPVNPVLSDPRPFDSTPPTPSISCTHPATPTPSVPPATQHFIGRYTAINFLQNFTESLDTNYYYC